MTRRNTDSPGLSSSPSASKWNGRRLAYDVLTAWQQRGAYAARVIEDLCRQHIVSSLDRSFAVDLSYTAIRRQATIDTILAAFVDRPRRDVEEGLWRLLQLGICQLVFLEGIPEHAAVHETGELAKQLQRPQWTNVVNGVLRAVSNSLDEETTTVPSPCGIPLGNDRFRNLDRAVFTDPNKNPAEYLSKAYSYPRWLIRDWLSRREVAEATRLCEWFNSVSPPTIRVNRLRQQPAVVQEMLQSAGLNTTAGQFPESLQARTPFHPVDVPGFREGWFSIQDASAMQAAHLLAPLPGERILDLCAAPGGKTTHLAELMQDSGQIIATDVDQDRLALVSQNVQRLGLTCVETRLISPNGDDIPNGPFDAVLVDVPCSNTGVLGKRPEARWRITSESLSDLVAIQTHILTQALARTCCGGRVVYSTCSIDPRENRDVVDSVLSNHPAVALEQQVIHIPGQPADGGYQALLRLTTECS